MKNAKKIKISLILDISDGIRDFFTRKSITQALIEQHSIMIFLTTGIPPYFADKREPHDIDTVKWQSQTEKRVIAIGEIGLDYYWNYGSKEEQLRLFIEQIDLANERNLPVIIHTRNSDHDLIDTLRHHPPNKAGIIHCFSSPPDSAKKFLDMGFFLSFAGNVTYKRSDHIRTAARIVPKDRYVIETDAPYLPPEGARGKPNEPANISLVARSIAEIRGIRYEEVVQQTTENATALLGIDNPLKTLE